MVLDREEEGLSSFGAREWGAYWVLGGVPLPNFHCLRVVSILARSVQQRKEKTTMDQQPIHILQILHVKPLAQG
ncbi:unnamed protein product [Victoria cruziana]